MKPNPALPLAIALFVAGCSTPPPLPDAADSSGADVSSVRGIPERSQRTTGPSPGQASAPSQVPRFSAAAPDAVKPPGWEPWILHPRKRQTRYDLLTEGGAAVIRATAAESASGLLAQVDVNPELTPVVQWRWRADQLVPGADNTDAALEDSPVRVVLAFDGDKSKLPVREQMFFERVKLLSGQDLPYATLMYIWENQQPVDAILSNPHTARIKKVVAASGSDGLKRWHELRRNYVADYERAFGKPPGRLIGVAVMTDTDNTRSKVVAWYGDIELLPH
jgi:hypothetical protein